MNNLNPVRTYQRTRTLDRVPAGTYLNTRAESALCWMNRQAKQNKLARSAMCYRMRLAAMLTADNRKGKIW